LLFAVHLINKQQSHCFLFVFSSSVRRVPYYYSLTFFLSIFIFIAIAIEYSVDGSPQSGISINHSLN
jgi:hypothetical protein